MFGKCFFGKFGKFLVNFFFRHVQTSEVITITADSEVILHGKCGSELTFEDLLMS